MPLTDKERQQINAIVGRFEAETGIQAIAAVTAKADAYPEIPWKAYAMGSALGAALAAVNPLVVSGWTHATIIAFDSMVILAAGAMLSLLAAFVPPAGRLFLDRLRAQNEAEQHAQGIFLERELFRTRSRRAVLVLMCRFERIAVVLADTGLARYAPHSALHAIGGEAKAQLRGDDLVAAFELTFSRVKALVTAGGYTPTALEENEIEDEVVTEPGA